MYITYIIYIIIYNIYIYIERESKIYRFIDLYINIFKCQYTFIYTHIYIYTDIYMYNIYIIYIDT